MKINILYKFQNQPWGGGNQFLKALKKEFVRMKVYEESPEKADVILFNSHHNFNEAFIIKKKFKEKIFIHRIDGPLYLTRGRSHELDKIIYKFDQLVADGIIFQSNWCREQNRKSFKISTKYAIAICNASDKEIFNRQKKSFNPDKIKLIASCWSSNLRKGFEIYKYLDENLNFLKYEMTFVGNSPIEFKNIKHIKPVQSEKLAEILKQHDIYITASQNDPCSNSLIEALSCGLPAVVLNGGGHPELIQEGGELFYTKQDIIKKIDKIAKNYYHYQSKIPELSMKKISQDYYEFARRVYEDVKQKKYIPQKINFLGKLNFYKIKLMILTANIKEKIC